VKRDWESILASGVHLGAHCAVIWTILGERRGC
jgi:hypothetical protein